MRVLTFVAAAAVASAIGITAVAHAGSHEEKPVAYRQAIFKIMGWNIGIVAAMAKGEQPYDAEEAAAAANAMAGRGPIMAGAFDESSKSKRTLDAIWEDPEAFQAAIDQYIEASSAFAAAAGSSVDDLRTALGPLGASCKNCHDDFRGRP